jgi:hypothetical protein
MPDPHPKDSVYVLHEGKVSSLDDVLFELLAMVKGYFLC